MDQKLQNILGASIIAALVLSVLAGVWYVKVFSDSKPPQRTFSVSGEGRVVAVPDVAEISFGVLTEGGKDIAVLQKENTGKINDIIVLLKQNGIDEKDIKTQYYNISPRYQNFSCPPAALKGESSAGLQPAESFPVPRPCLPPEIIGYAISQNLSVKIRDLNKAGDVLAGIVQKGANNVYGPTFTLDDPKAPQNEARAKAIAEARQKAEAMAKAGGFRLGKLVSIQEGYAPYPILAAERTSSVAGGGAAPPEIQPGSQEVIVSVSLVYEIK